MNWARTSSVAIAVAVALVIIANAPAVVVEPIQNAVAQIRWNAYNRDRVEAAALQGSETNPTEAVTPTRKAK